MNLEDFCKKLNVSVPPAKLVGRSYFDFGSSFDGFLSKHPVFVGGFVGTVSGERFIPGINFLQHLASCPRRAVLSDEGAWLFICGRDVFRKSIVKLSGSLNLGDFVVVMNKHDECIGYCEFINSGDIFLKNLFDIGASLRARR